MEKQEFIESILVQLKPGESTHITGEEDVIREICEDKDVTVEPMEGNIFKITLNKHKGRSKRAQIGKLLKAYKIGHELIPFEAAYVRQIVSKWNSDNNDAFKVRTDIDGNVYAFKSVQDRQHITQDEFNDMEQEFKVKLKQMSARIKPEAFFDDEELI